ncbi:MAG: hypothetical protein H0X66_16655 [Verrucomicrobia bacterium]|nr:hypothetical protein [Verrucomicrobiota bacterium]
MKPQPQKPTEEEWEDPYPKKKRTNWIAGIFIALLVYVFSIGPATLLASKGIISMNVWETVYGPLIALAAQFPTVDGLFNWYIGLWGK